MTIWSTFSLLGDCRHNTASVLRTDRDIGTVCDSHLTDIDAFFLLLGLVGYYDSDASKSDDESDSDNEQDAEQQRASDVDSETELMVNPILTRDLSYSFIHAIHVQSNLQKTIQRRKAAFENKSIEIESYLAEIEEKEKQWLEQDDGVKTEDTDSPDNSSPAPPSSNDETQRDIPKVPAGENRAIKHN